MWHDNETETDLLGIDHLVSMIITLLHNDALLPLTLGVFGDWGSGKSSLMCMAQKRLESDKHYICVRFSPWQYESYDDVKVALMASVLTTLRDHRPFITKAEDQVHAQVERQITKLFKRIDWLRLASATAKGVGTVVAHAHGMPTPLLATSAIADLGHMVQPAQLPQLEKNIHDATQGVLKDPNPTTPDQDREPIEQSIHAFRHDFATLLNDLPVKALVVFLDDLDRCLPPNIIETFEAIRLFLAVPKTAFVIGADERIIRHAIGSRYPDLAGQGNDIGRDYLEKIVQIPLRIPPLNSSETESYLNLLGSQLYLDSSSHTTLVEAAAHNRQKRALDVAMNYGIATSHVPAKDIPQPLEAHMQLASHIAPILCREFVGNPRQIKRFMNTLLLRRLLAQTQDIPLEMATLAKIMILEYFHEAYFRQLFQWQADGHGVAAQLAQLEDAVAHAQTLPGDALRDWFTEPALKTWLSLEPSLAQENLEGYFYIARDRLSFSNTHTQRLSQLLQELLSKLRAESDTERQQGIKEARLLSSSELHTVYSILLAHFQRDPQAFTGKRIHVLLQLAVHQPDLVPMLAHTLRSSTPSSIQSALPIAIKTTFSAHGPLPQELVDVLQHWSIQQTNSPLTKAAKLALKDTH